MLQVRGSNAHPLYEIGEMAKCLLVYMFSLAIWKRILSTILFRGKKDDKPINICKIL